MQTNCEIEGLICYCYDRCSSTMDVAREIGAPSYPGGAFIVQTDFQEKGRGRMPERPWAAPPGENLLFTLSFPVAGLSAVPVAMSLRAGLAAALAAGDIIPALRKRLAVKWPNDVMVGGKKTAGLLTESDGSRVLLGVGVNVMQRDFGEAGANATSLAVEAGIENIDRFVLLSQIIRRLKNDIIDQKLDWLGELNKILYKKGEKVRFEAGGADSGNIIEGKLDGVDSGGAVLIDDKPYWTGELRF
jgi:BirA family biotin operon repressor/biotin-[acetyl-CoA-carboxylase] ligase